MRRQTRHCRSRTRRRRAPAGESDIAELRRQNGQLATMLADATDKFIYMDGTVYCPAGKASVSGDTVTFGSTCSVSGSTVTLS